MSRLGSDTRFTFLSLFTLFFSASEHLKVAFGIYLAQQSQPQLQRWAHGGSQMVCMLILLQSKSVILNPGLFEP